MVTNGRVDLAQLHLVDGWAYLAPGCAAAWDAFQRTVTDQTGITPQITYPDGAYRPYVRQVYWWNIFQRDGRPVAAYPGTSNHGLGMAVDISNYLRFNHATLVRIGLLHGFVFDTASEPWHMKYTRDPHYKSLSPAGTITDLLTDDIQGVKEMFYVNSDTLVKGKVVDGTTTWVVCGGSAGTSANWDETKSLTRANAIKKQLGPWVSIGQQVWDDKKSRYLEPLRIATTTINVT